MNKIISPCLFLFLAACTTTKQEDVMQVDLKDSSSLTHIKGPFYKNKSGQLFERTFAQREMNGVDTMVEVEYFNGLLPQAIDAMTFEELDGWYAKDKNHVYYRRPVSGGMLNSILDSADVKSFKILEGEYLYGVDKNYLFKETQIIHGVNPSDMKFEKDENGDIEFVNSNGKKIKTK